MVIKLILVLSVMVSTLLIIVVGLAIYGRLQYTFCFKHWKKKDGIGYLACLHKLSTHMCPKCDEDEVTGCQIYRHTGKYRFDTLNDHHKETLSKQAEVLVQKSVG